MSFLKCSLYTPIGGDSVFLLRCRDFHYEDLNVDSVPRRIQALDRVLNSPSQRQLFSSPLASIWDDHDWLGELFRAEGLIPSQSVPMCVVLQRSAPIGVVSSLTCLCLESLFIVPLAPQTGNDSNGYNGFRDAALEAFRLAMPSYTPLPSKNSAYQAFTIGTVRFVISDLRSESTETSIYSKEQKEWLFQELSKSDQYDFVIWVTPKPWIEEETPGSDAWKGYSADRAELSQWISTQVTKKNVLAISSDAHMLAFDDGSNTYYGDATTSATTNASSTSSGPIESFPLLQSGPLDRLGSFKGGGFWCGVYPVLEILFDPRDHGTQQQTSLFPSVVHKMKFAQVPFRKVAPRISMKGTTSTAPWNLFPATTVPSLNLVWKSNPTASRREAPNKKYSPNDYVAATFSDLLTPELVAVIPKSFPRRIQHSFPFPFC
jgi:hypothetical protein